MEIQKNTGGKILPLFELMANETLPLLVGISSPSTWDPKAVHVQSSWAFDSGLFTQLSF